MQIASDAGGNCRWFQLIVLEEETERLIQNISPINPAKEEVEIHNLKQGDYLVYMEVHVSSLKKILLLKLPTSYYSRASLQRTRL